MIRLAAARAACLLALLLCFQLAQAKENLFVFVFKEGVAQSGIRVSVGDARGETNAFGYVSFDLPADTYEVAYYQGDSLFAVSEVSLLNSVSSQIFLNLGQDGAEVELDLPLSAYEQNFDVQTIKPQQGPKGTLRVKVLDNQTEAPIAKVKLFFRGYAVDASTDENGIANLPLSEGQYDVSFIHPKYVMRVQKDIRIKADAITDTEIKLNQADIVLDEYVVTAPFVEGSLASTIAEIKGSDVVGDALSAEQFSKSGDSSASGALKRVTAITIVDGKFVFVRGLGERYSTVLLNDLHVPSPEPTKRVVPLDIFPSDVIQSLEIQKSYSSDLPGTFGGGTVLINTKDIPKEDNFISGSISVKANDSTGDDAVFNPDNSKPMPGIILDLSDNFGQLTQEQRLGDLIIAEGISAEQRDALDRAMVSYRSYGLQSRSIKPGTSLSGTIGQSFKTSNGIKYGLAGNVYYKTDEKNILIERNDYQFFPTEGKSELTDDNEFDVTTLSEQLGGLISLGLEPNQQNKLKYTFLALNENQDFTSFGIQRDIEDGRFNERTLYQYIERELISHQVNGEHLLQWGNGKHGGDGLFKALQINWGYGLSEASRLEPGTFEFEYRDSVDELVLDQNSMYYLYSNLEDEVDDKRLDLSLPFTLNGADNAITVGLAKYEKNRALDNRRFSIRYDVREDPRPIDEQLNETVAATDDLNVLNAYRPADFYTAEQVIDSVYAKVLISPIENLDLSAGIRREESTQKLLVGAEAGELKLETNDNMPFAGLTYRFNDEHQVRLGYSESISRPDFREFSENRYIDPETSDVVFGYPGLKETHISSLDVKYEWFPAFDEFYSIGIFTKDFENPVETVRERQDVDINISYRNAESAKSLGLELGFRKGLDFVSENFENYFVSGNYAYIDSQIKIDKNAPENANDSFISGLTSTERPMQGQSPYVVNLSLGYDNFFTRRSAILLYNVYGKRISTLGIDNNPDIYEQPFHKVDFVVKWGLNDTYDDQVKRIAYTLNFKAENLLNSKIEKKEGSRITESRRVGQSYTLGLSLKF